MPVSHIIVADSRDRDYEGYPSNSNYRLMLPKSYKDIIGARLVSVELPGSFYVFSSLYNNTSLAVSIGILQQTVTIPDGNYSTETMPTALKTALEAAFPGQTFDVSVDPATLKLVISNDLTSFSIDGGAFATEDSAEWGLAYYLGFDKTVVSGNVVTSSRVMTMNPQTYVLLDIPELNAVDEMGLFGNPVGRGCFAKLALQGNSFEYVYGDSTNIITHPVLPTPRASIDRLTIQWRFHNGNFVNFQGIEHSFTIELVCKDPGLPKKPQVQKPVHITHNNKTIVMKQPPKQPKKWLTKKKMAGMGCGLVFLALIWYYMKKPA